MLINIIILLQLYETIRYVQVYMTGQKTEPDTVTDCNSCIWWLRKAFCIIIQNIQFLIRRNSFIL